jgi:uncharacterized protein DUF3309
MGTVLLIIIVLLLIGALPTWPYSSGWGYYPSGGLGLILDRAHSRADGPLLGVVEQKVRSPR